MRNAFIPSARSKKAALIAGGFLLVAAGMAVFIWQRTPKETPAFASVIDMPTGSAIHSTIEYRGGAQDLASVDGNISAPTAPTAAPYKLDVSVQLPGDAYRDFSFAVSADGKTLSVVADGFHAGDKVDLRIDGQNRFERLPADWSGKIELSAPIDGKQAQACIEIFGRQETLGLCHTLPEARTS